MKTYTWKEAIYEVMRENGGEMTTNEITNAILEKGLKNATATTIKNLLFAKPALPVAIGCPSAVTGVSGTGATTGC